MPKPEITTIQKQATKLICGDKQKLKVGVQESLDTVLTLKKKLSRIAEEAALDVADIGKAVIASITIHDAEKQLVDLLNKESRE